MENTKFAGLKHFVTYFNLFFLASGNTPDVITEY